MCFVLAKKHDDDSNRPLRKTDDKKRFFFNFVSIYIPKKEQTHSVLGNSASKVADRTANVGLLKIWFVERRLFFAKPNLQRSAVCPENFACKMASETANISKVILM